MSDKTHDGAFSVPDQAPEPIVAFYLTQETGPPATFRGEYQIVTIEIRDSSGKPIRKPALRVTFSPNQSVEEPVGLVGFGSDPRCHVLLSADVISSVHCRVYAQLNSGPQVWLVDDCSTQGTQVKDDETSRDKLKKIVHGRRQAAPGLHALILGPYSFHIRAPVSDIEIRRCGDWFRLNKPISVTSSMLHRQLCGREYDCLRMNQVGKGGNGEVYRYMEKNTALFIAIKEEPTKTKEQKAQVMKEINLMKSLRHPFLVDILFDDCDNKPLPTFYTAMPLYIGHLGSLLPLPNMPTTERVMLQITEGLRFMHSNQILHRDLKPANVLVVSGEHVKIADYGWATSLKDTCSLYGVCGTAAYCAPEAFKPNEIHTPALDVYSLGAIFFSMLGWEQVNRGWILREFQGHEEVFNTTFENASRNPPPRFPGLVQSMLTSDPKNRCSLDECKEIVRAQNYDWNKGTFLMPLAVPIHVAAGKTVTQKTVNATRLQQTPFGQARVKANMPKLTLFARVKSPENRQNPQRAPVKCDYKKWPPVMQRQESAAPIPLAVQTQKPCEPAHVQGINFNAGLPSYEEATSHNPFAKKASKGEQDKQSSHHKSKTNDNILRYRTKEPPVQRAAKASIPERQPRKARQITRRSREKGMIIHGAQDAGVHKRREQLERQATKKKRVADLKKGAYEVAKGYFVVYRALFGLACGGLAEGSKWIYERVNDNPGARMALEDEVPSENANAQLVASMQRHSLKTTLSNRLTASARQRPFRDYTEKEMRDHQLMLSRLRLLKRS
ncbi:MAG: hypothetical protein Q9161_005868 [Pseudevernia consocians]